MRLCEAALLLENLARLRFILRLARVRESLCTEEGDAAMQEVQNAVIGVMKSAYERKVPYRQALQTLRRDLDSFEAGVVEALAVARRDDLRIFAKWPLHMDVFIEVLGQQLGSQSRVQRWMPFLWHLANQEIGQTLIISELIFCGPVWSMGVALVRGAFRTIDVPVDMSSEQMQIAFSNWRDFLCSVVRGSRALRLWAVRLSC